MACGDDHLPLRFELWYVRAFGWCVPTLLIRQPGRRSSQTSARTYATTLDGKPVRIGLGPHVEVTCTVHVREGSRKRLQSYLDLQRNGAVTANEIRDRISTRRAQSALRRRFF
jgi:hypothetical protein